MVLLGIGFCFLCRFDGCFCQSRLAGHRFGFCHLYPHIGYFGCLGGIFELCGILSGLATGASWLAYFKALQMGEASKVAPVDKFSIVLVALFAVVLKEWPSSQEWLGIGLIAAGVLTLAETFAKKHFPRQLKPKHRFSAVFAPNHS